MLAFKRAFGMPELVAVVGRDEGGAPVRAGDRLVGVIGKRINSGYSKVILVRNAPRKVSVGDSQRMVESESVPVRGSPPPALAVDRNSDSPIGTALRY